MYELLWFISGAVIYQILARLLRITQIYLFFQEIHLHILTMLEAASHDLDSAREIKEQFLQECKIDKEEIKQLAMDDKTAVEIWKETAVLKLYSYMPPVYKSAADYTTWNGLINHLNKLTKK